MGKKTSVRYFLGANSAGGFYSLYDDFVCPKEGDFLWVIKGGPGCGKSTFMKKIGKAAENAGFTVEYILCSGDPDSLDGVYIKEKRTAYVDGTAPHVIDCTLPGGSGLYLDMGAFYRPDPLLKRRETLENLTHAYKARYTRAYELLRAVESVSPERIPGLKGEVTLAAVKKRAESMARRYISAGNGFTRRSRFLSAISCQGIYRLPETVVSLCRRVVTLENAFGLADTFLKEVYQTAQQRQQPVILCPCPLNSQRLEAVLLPEADLAFVAEVPRETWPGPVWRHLRLDAMVDGDAVRSHREELRRVRHIREELLSLAVESLQEAKALHDTLEGTYRPYVDFSGLDELCRLHTDYLLGVME